MSVYLYEGNSRDNATIPIIERNRMAEDRKEYAVPLDSGILMISLPDFEQDTGFDFEYYIDTDYVAAAASMLKSS
jgi:hypothetical protein